jgi:molybdopterin molybdotransferase
MPERGANIRKRGEDIASGGMALRSGTAIGPVEIATLAALGCAKVPVLKRPVVAILATGTELCDVGGKPGRDQIFDSNSYAVDALVRVFGGVPRRFGIIGDEPEAVGKAVAGAAECDAVVTTGGVSVGDYDYVRGALAAAGCQEVFWGVSMRPGRPFFFGMLAGRPVFGLPGNAVSAMVTFTVLAGPALLAMGGDGHPLPVAHKAVVTGGIKKKRGITLLARAHVTRGEGGLLANPSGGQGSHQVFGMAGANALCVIPEDSGDVSSGESVEVIPFGSRNFNIFD